MERDFKTQLLDVVSRYVDATGTDMKAISVHTMKDARFLERLIKGKGCTLLSATKVLRYLSANWPDDAEWPADVFRPSTEYAEAAE